MSIPNWIEAGSAVLAAMATVCIAVLTYRTLNVLRVYANDTRRIADDSSQQIERGQMPFVAVATDPTAGLLLENQGFGPAINIQYSGCDLNKEEFKRAVPSLAVKGIFQAHREIFNTFLNNRALEITYTSLRGKKYRSIVKRTGMTMETIFIEEPEVSAAS
jgi:hypothetical protein